MDHVQQQTRQPGGRGALGWVAFILIAMLLAAAVIAGTIKSSLSPSQPTSTGALPSLSGPPSPAPPPLPKPGGAPPHTDQASL